MKVLVNEVTNEGLEILLGQNITVWCGVYIYTGKLVGVTDSYIKLEDAKIVYETGSFADSSWADAQSLGADWYIRLPAIESFGVMNKK